MPKAMGAQAEALALLQDWHFFLAHRSSVDTSLVVSFEVIFFYLPRGYSQLLQYS